MKAEAKHLPKAPVLDVQVTPEIIDRAVARDSGYCMFAEAIREAFPDAGRGISVDLQTCRVTDKKRGLRYIYLTPRSLQTAIVDFDQGIEVKPFSIRLRGAHVIRKASLRRKAGMPTEAEQEQRKEAAKKGRLAKAATRLESASAVPTRVGGAAPPVQKTRDGVPYSRRREFGLRALAR